MAASWWSYRDRVTEPPDSAVPCFAVLYVVRGVSRPRRGHYPEIHAADAPAENGGTAGQRAGKIDRRRGWRKCFPAR